MGRKVAMLVAVALCAVSGEAYACSGGISALVTPT